jgi:DNA-binding MltR family transcriptional regulator
MPYEVPIATVERYKGFVVYDSGSTDHRGLVIRTTCDLENALAKLLFSHFTKMSPRVTWERAQKELFSESGLLSSLSKMTKIATYLGLVTADEAHDLRLLARLRNMYAHGRQRDQLDRDQEASRVIMDLVLHKNSAATFAGSEIEWIYLGCTAHLLSLLEQYASAESRGAA